VRANILGFTGLVFEDAHRGRICLLVFIGTGAKPEQNDGGCTAYFITTLTDMMFNQKIAYLMCNYHISISNSISINRDEILVET
jgi:hypothetical protein